VKRLAAEGWSTIVTQILVRIHNYLKTTGSLKSALRALIGLDEPSIKIYEKARCFPAAKFLRTSTKSSEQPKNSWEVRWYYQE